MTQEEKAKRYDNMFERLKEMYNNNKTNVVARLICERYFPELKESEDERIRKDLIQFFKEKDEEDFEEWVPKAKILAWLEKQGEHANFRNKIQIGDKVTRNEDGVLVNLSQLKRVAKPAEEQGEQKPAEFDDTNAKRMFIKALERVEEQNNKGYKLTDCDKNSWWEDFKAYTTSKQILANSAKTCKDEQKPAWSEEDELIVAKILCICNDFERSFESSPSSMKVIKEDVDKIDNWLKSLKERYTWKPSDEQIRALNYVVNLMASSERPTENDLYYNILKSLKEQLKRLREE